MPSKRERLEAAIRGELADRPPIALWRHFPVDDQDPAQLAEAHLDFQSTYDFDFLKVTPASSFCIRDYGAEDEWRGHPEGTREYTRRPIRQLEDWRSLAELDPRTGMLGAQLACLKMLEAGLSGGTPFIQTVFSPLAQAKNLAGEARLFQHLHQDPQSVLRGLEMITRTTIAFVQAAAETGASGIFYAIQHASYRFFDLEGYRRFGLAFDSRILEAAEGYWLNVLHLHGGAPIFDIAEQLDPPVVNWHDREVKPDLAAALDRVRGVVCGGLRRQESLVLGDPSAVRREAQEAKAATGGRRFILGAGCVTPIVAPRANLRAAREAYSFA